GPNRRWVVDFTQVGTRVADVYVAFVIDCYSRYIVGWQCAYHMRMELVLDALEMALSNRVVHKGQLIHHSDHGSQGGFNRSSQHLNLGGVCMGRPKGWTTKVTGRPVMRSPGRPL